MITPLTSEDPQTQPRNKPNSQLKDIEMHRNDMKRNQMNGSMRHETSNLHMNIIMTESLGKEDQRPILRIEENKEPT